MCVLTSGGKLFEGTAAVQPCSGVLLDKVRVHQSAAFQQNISASVTLTFQLTNSTVILLMCCTGKYYSMWFILFVVLF